MKVRGHVDALYGPIDCIDKLDKPILFMYGKKDIYSVPEMSEKLIEKCQSKKKVVWFSEGAHSHLKINAMEKYDNEICDFLKGLEG